jgi:hypothetical protein
MQMSDQELLPGRRIDGHEEHEEAPMLSTVLIIVLILLLVGALPTWPHSARWGYGPGGILGLVLVVIVVLALLGRI